MTELWQNIADFKGYAVSTYGRVRSLARRVPHPKGGTRLLGARILKTQPATNGYSRVTLRRDGKTINQSVHRLVAEAFILNPYAFPEVDHEDRNRTNNAVENLSWKTHIDNAAKGEHHAHKLTVLQVKSIRKSLAEGVTQTRLAEKYGVAQNIISRIKHSQLWKGI